MSARDLAIQAGTAYATGGASLAAGGIGGDVGGDSMPKQISSRAGDASLSFGGFGGVNLGGGQSSQNTLYVALAAVVGIALLLVVLLKR